MTCPFWAGLWLHGTSSCSVCCLLRALTFLARDSNIIARSVRDSGRSCRHTRGRAWRCKPIRPIKTLSDYRFPWRSLAGLPAPARGGDEAAQATMKLIASPWPCPSYLPPSDCRSFQLARAARARHPRTKSLQKCNHQNLGENTRYSSLVKCFSSEQKGRFTVIDTCAEQNGLVLNICPWKIPTGGNTNGLESFLVT